MTKASFTLRGNNIRKEILAATADFQTDNYVVRHDFDSGTVFMFEQFKRSVNNFVLNVIIDFSIETSHPDEFVLQCIAMGGKNRGEIVLLFNLEKSIMVDFRAHFFGYCDRYNFNWAIGELQFEK